MPPTAEDGSPVVLQSSPGQMTTVPAAGHSPVFVSHFQPMHLMNQCLQTQGPVQMPELWTTTYVPFPGQHGTMMVHPLPLLQGPAIAGPPPVNVNHQPVMSCSPPANQVFNPLANSTNMEVVWHGIFNQLFSSFFPAIWTLIPASTIPTDSNCKVFQDSAKVRFLCQTCGKAWTSMKGRVVFGLSLDRSANQGAVFFKLFGQQCQKCTPGSFEHAMWYPEEVQKVLMNVFHAVGQTHYGLIEAPVYRERRRGKPRTQHNSSLCQACADRICLEGNFERRAVGLLGQ